MRRFIERNLLVEITSDARLLRVFGWMLTRHPVMAYALYTGGASDDVNCKWFAEVHVGGHRPHTATPLMQCAGCTGFIRFVLTLQKGHYLHQFGQFAWIHMILLVVFIPSSFFVSNIFDGLIWFLRCPAPWSSSMTLAPTSQVRFIWDVHQYLSCECLSWCLSSGLQTWGMATACRVFPGPHAADQAVAQEDVGGVCWRGLDHPLCLLVPSRFMSKFRWMTCPAR